MSSLFRRKLDELEDMFISSQDDLLARFSSTYEECKHLKEENERIKEDRHNQGLTIQALTGERDYLKAEVERLKERNQFLEQVDSYLQNGINNANEERCIELEAQVKRLEEFGESMLANNENLNKKIEKITTAGNAVVNRYAHNEASDCDVCVSDVYRVNELIKAWNIANEN